MRLRCAYRLLRDLQDAEAGFYDVIIVDSSDPVGPASVLFTKVSLAVALPALLHHADLQLCSAAIFPGYAPRVAPRWSHLHSRRVHVAAP